MADTAELLKARFAEIADELSTDVTGRRNDIAIGDADLPAIVTFDGDEEVDPQRQAPRARKGTPVIATLLPEALIGLHAKPEDIGTELQTLGLKFFNAVMLDAQLWELVGPNGAVRYRGHETDLGAARALQGAMLQRYAFDYVLRPGST